MHNLKGRVAAQLDTFSGLLTLADPTSLPEGASPRNTNVDFNVGSVYTRSGLFNPFVYQNAAVGPSTGGAAVDVSTNGVAWANPANVLTNNYASVTLVSPVARAGVPTSATQPQPASANWANLPSIFGGGSPPASIDTSPLPTLGQAIIAYGSAIPADSTVVGIEVSFTAFATSGTALPSLQVNASVTPKIQAVTATPTTYTLGSPSDLWGGQFSTPAVISGGAAVSLLPVTGGASNQINVYDFTITVYFTPAYSDDIQVTEFGFSVPSTATPQGFQIAVNGYAALGANLLVQMLKSGAAVGNIESVALNVGSPTIVNLGGVNDLFGASWLYSDLNATNFGIRMWVEGVGAVYLSLTTLTCIFTPTQENFDYVTTFEDNFGTIRTVALDANGDFWVENVSANPGTLMPLFGGLPSDSFASSFTFDSRQYIAPSDLLQGNYPPQQYTGQWNDRVSQVGPGAPPNFTGISAPSDTFDIVNITQPAQKIGTRGTYYLQSSGPGSTAPGNVVTVYYSDSTNSSPPQDTDLVNAFNSGYPVYAYIQFSGYPTSIGPYTQMITSVGEAQPPGQPRNFYYFTYNVPSVAFTYYAGSGHTGYVVTYQRSLATMTTTTPVPNLIIGNQITVTGTTPSGWDNLWTITQTPNSGSFIITETSVLNGVATYVYSLVTGVAPTVGQQVTITGTDNANGALNLVNASIVSATGGNSGSFTVNVSSGNFGVAPEQGQATTAGTIFDFDPGASAAGSDIDPIFGKGTGGSFTFAGNGQFIADGTRKGTVFFITRNGYYTAPAPPVTFSIPENTTAIQASNIPIGPTDVIARGISFTEGGANGVPGANFFTIPDPVQYIVDNVTYTASSLFINDNTTTTASFTFTDTVLLNAEAIDIQGNDLFNLGEIGDCAWCTSYAGRTVWGRVRTKIQNFLNLSFDGGYLANPGGPLSPLGWNLIQTPVPITLLNSPVFGNSLYIHNVTGITQPIAGLLYQSAYEDYNNVAILQNQTAYSVRVTARTPGSGTSGALVIDLTAFDTGTGFGNTYGTFTLPLSSMTSTMATYQGTLLTNSTLNIPADLVLRVYGSNLTNDEDIEVDRIEVFPTEQPTNLTQLVMSYENDPESFDQVTGGTDTTTVNTQPANGAFTMHDQLYVVKESSLGYLSDSPNQEPANWNPFKEVSNVAGACGINAYDVGEEWAVMACQNGLFLFNGGAPMPIQLEIPDIWKAINWSAGQTICIRNDVANRKIFCAIPLPTPNPWMIDATENSTPTTPNVILMLNYDGIGNIEELMNAAAMHITMMGKLAVHDMRRKWSMWTIPTPYIGLIKRNELYSTMMFCNGIGSSKIYTLDGPQGFDDGSAFTSSYCTYGFIDRNKEAENPLFGLFNKRYVGGDMLALGSNVGPSSTVKPIAPAVTNLTCFQNTLDAPYPFVVPGGFSLFSNAANDYEFDLDEYAQRLFCEVEVDFGFFNLSRLTLYGRADNWSPMRGVKG